MTGPWQLLSHTVCSPLKDEDYWPGRVQKRYALLRLHVRQSTDAPDTVLIGSIQSTLGKDAYLRDGA